MKKALVLAIVMVLGLGVLASAQTWEGTWDTDITLYPTALLFADFIGFDSDLTVSYTIGGWEFGMDADFSTGGMDGLGFDAEGTMGAFSFDVDLDFEPMLLSKQIITYTGLGVQTGGACLADKLTWRYDTKLVENTYGPAFDDLTVEGSVSIAGIDLSTLFYLKGTDMDGGVTYSSWEFAGIPKQFSETSGATSFTATTVNVASSTKVGSGAKLTIGGSFAGATITNYTYFNLVEYSDWAVSAYDVDHIATKLQMSGTLSGLACPGCDVMFTRNYTLIEGLAVFGDCGIVDIAVDFSCCDFEGFSVLIKDIGLGCCWDLNFDFLVEFDTISKTMSLEPEMTFASACFTIDAEISYSGSNVFDGIELEGLSYSQSFNGVAVSFAATWDYADNPLIGTSSTITHYGIGKVFFWKPDTHASDLTADNPVFAGYTTGADPVDTSWNYVLDYAYCAKEVATVYNKLSLDFDADACCGGVFDLDVDTYFGEVKGYTLAGLYGTYYYAEAEASVWTEVDFLGSDNGYDKSGASLYVIVDDPSWSAATEDECDPCPADEATGQELLVLVEDWGTGTTLGTILGWVETDADIVVGVGSNFSLGLGVDVAWWGWENISFSVEFTF